LSQCCERARREQRRKNDLMFHTAPPYARGH
jgi:hypothetical protein